MNGKNPGGCMKRLPSSASAEIGFAILQQLPAIESGTITLTPEIPTAEAA
jgi:hypothetical protein